MPDLDGFDVLESLDERERPAIIFVTAYDRYALRAFDVHALDYLLKPFDRARFERALDRAAAQLRERDAPPAGARLAALLEDLRRDRRRPRRIVIRTGGRIFFVNVSEIDWIEAAGNYVKLHVGRSSHLLRDTMKRLETDLESAGFIRLHRSTLVNGDRIRELQQTAGGDWELVLADGTRLSAGRDADARLRQTFERAARSGGSGR